MIDHLCATMLLSIRIFFVITTTYLSISFCKIASDKMSAKLKGGSNEKMVLQAAALPSANKQR